MSQMGSISSRFQAKCWLPAMVASLLLIGVGNTQQSRLLGWDEVDYAVATGQGFRANYLDTTALKATDFIRFTKAKLKNQPSQFGADYDEEKDVFVRRHMHPPLLQYLMTVAGLGVMTDGRHDHLLLGFQLAGGILLIIVTNIAVFKMTNRSPDLSAGLAITTCGFLAAFHLTREIQYHLWFAITLCLVAMGLGRYFKKTETRQAAMLGGLLGLSFLALETGLFAFVLTLFLISLNHLPKFNRHFFGNLFRSLPWVYFGVITGIMFLTIFLLWPASVLKLSLPRILSIYAYRIYLGEEYAGGNQLYYSLINRTLPLIFVSGLGMWATWHNRPSSDHYYRLAFAGLGLLYGLLMLKFMLNITYMMPALAVLSVVGLAAVVELKPSIIKSLACLILLISTGWIYVNEKPVDTYATREGIQNLAALIEKHPALIEAAHLSQFYLPQLQNRIQGFHLTYKGDAITVRKDMKYEPLGIDMMKNHMIIFYNRQNIPPSAIETRIRSIARPLEIPGVSARAYLFITEVNKAE